MITLRHGILEQTQAVAGGATYPTDGLILRLAFESDDASLADTSGNGFDWESSDANPLWGLDSDGKPGMSWASNATGSMGNDRYTIQNNDDPSVYRLVAGTNNFTIACWVSCFDATTTRDGRIIDFHTYPDSYRCKLSTPPDATRIDWIRNRAASLSYTIDMDTSTWHHIVITYDGTDEKMYFDNSLEDTNTTSTSVTTPQVVSIGSSLLGGRNHLGLVDQVYFYNRALDTDEIDQLYNNGAGV